MGPVQQAVLSIHVNRTHIDKQQKLCVGMGVLHFSLVLTVIVQLEGVGLICFHSLLSLLMLFWWQLVFLNFVGFDCFVGVMAIPIYMVVTQLQLFNYHNYRAES